jgi:hypothetical protein
MALKKWYEGLKRGDQVSHIYNTNPEQLKVVTDLIAWMMDREKLVILTDRWQDESDLPGSRILEAAIEEDRLEVISIRHVEDVSGRIKPEALSNSVEIELIKAREEGLEGLLYVWDLDWAKRQPSDFEAFIEYQSKSMVTSSPHNLTVLGQYDLEKMTKQQLERVLRVSPLVLEEGELNRNFWVVSTSTMSRPTRDARQLTRTSEQSKAKQS